MNGINILLKSSLVSSLAIFLPVNVQQEDNSQ
jgi:hypothetical protein